MNSSSPKCTSDGSHNSKFSLLGQQLMTYSSFLHNQPSSNSLDLEFSCGSVSHSHAQPQDHSIDQNLIVQSHEQSQALTRSGSASTNLHQLLAFGMGSYSPHSNAQLVQGMQESVSYVRSNMPRRPSPVADASSQALMTALMLLQQKLGHLQSLVQLMARGDQSNAAIIQQQMATAAGVATVISQLVTAAAGLLPQVHQQSEHALCEQRNHFGSASSPDMTPFQQIGSANARGTTLGISESNSRFSSSAGRGEKPNSGFESVVTETGLDGSPELGGHLFRAHVGNSQYSNMQNSIETILGNSLLGSFAAGLGSGVGGTTNLEEGNRALCAGNPYMSNISMEFNSFLEDQELGGGGLKDDEDDGEAEILPPGSYELIELDAMEILAEHTHFCEICGKGFKRDANLRMHMRGHGDEYKTVAALAKPEKSTENASLRKPRRYSCPYLGCKRNKKHKKFLPLKTMLCVKNHYRRSHCPKMLTCTKCKTKKFSVVADLKTHEKHCGRDKWQCSCGNTFSRKDKLLGHLGLFVGHTPATPLFETDLGESSGGMEGGKTETGSASGNGTTSIFDKGFVSESNETLGTNNGSKLGSGYSLGLSGSNSQSVSAVGFGGAGGSALKLDGERTGEEEMTLASTRFTSSEDGFGTTTLGPPVAISSSFESCGSGLTGSRMLQGLLRSEYLQGSVPNS
ncbi:hypothetical protein O6H91_02G056600 [Diphasiastrum complanatum]|uniref:Uncharacterized protein n=11 Tax=Diphasiastrum complanatum TaxID=34168 RepID=A0ACC2EG39_DIPCM|nr:hypothetical protein O6H91_02G056600 [Diphasiastrum complanatum]KAJ7565330.1 hypothetical protein O6H91_02G056600 [Diphasiastrum complanatum]KAJ7565331.1 hypothetical protein O6H91_02G056600 [Diphasiastrum complanatum]KAJ7565332.1 hypothetical protein O6H91_02G056600 [Diphasiastrum complanatum]KAJ7565333.1 hypothetical protein O6H91_02G056600 [Diphasiastrum complanatum]